MSGAPTSLRQAANYTLGVGTVVLVLLTGPIALIGFWLPAALTYPFFAVVFSLAAFVTRTERRRRTADAVFWAVGVIAALAAIAGGIVLVVTAEPSCVPDATTECRWVADLGGDLGEASARSQRAEKVRVAILFLVMPGTVVLARLLWGARAARRRRGGAAGGPRRRHGMTAS